MDEAKLIISEWGLDESLHTKESILAALSVRMADLLLQDPMGFLQLMYRLDIPEAQLNQALDADNASDLVVQLIWDRQVQKSIQRKMKPPPAATDEDLNW